MHPQLPVSLLFSISTLYRHSLALPFLQLRGTPTESIVARASWSVVPIDGSGGEGGDSSSDEPSITVIKTQTVVSTGIPTTKTVLESLPPITSILTVTPDPHTYTQTVPTTISIIDVEPTTSVTTTTVTESDEPTSVLSTSSIPEPTSSAQTSPSTLPTITASSQATQTATSHSSSADTLFTSYSMIPTSTFVQTSMPAPAPTSTSTSLTSKSYDDGFWHTTYPPWSNGTMVRRYSHEQ